MLETDSSMIEFAEDNKLNSSRDTVFSLMGVVRGIQTIADRTFILGDVRSDQVVVTNSATPAIKQLANFEVDTDNPYNKVSDYYAIINNCNYYIANADTALVKLGKKVFEKEFAAIKSYRAWTYLQLVKNYGEVPLVLKPVLTEAEAAAEMSKSYSDINAICNYFIEDIKPYVDTEYPSITSSGAGMNVNVRVLLGELCLWAGKYKEAAQYLHEYLTMKNKPVPTGLSSKQLTSYKKTEYGTYRAYFSKTAYDIASSNERLFYIPMAYYDYEGVKSELSTVYESALSNNYYAQIEPSQALKKLSSDQNYTYCIEASQTEKDTLYIPKGGWTEEFLDGDLRLYSTLTRSSYDVDEASPFSRERLSNYKLTSSRMWFYRVQQVYLMYAEALNRLGYPEAAMCVLKYGLRNQNIERYVSEKERAKAGSLLDFDDEVFTKDNTMGVHGRGCGDVECDNNYCVPQPKNKLASYEDTVQYQIPLVEQMIIDEYGLEFTFEGKRFYDLMRVALRRNDPAYLADAIAKRNGTTDATLRSKLMEKKNWYLPLK